MIESKYDFKKKDPNSNMTLPWNTVAWACKPLHPECLNLVRHDKTGLFKMRSLTPVNCSTKGKRYKKLLTSIYSIIYTGYRVSSLWRRKKTQTNTISAILERFCVVSWLLAQSRETNESGIQNPDMCIFLTKAHFRAGKNKQEPYCTYFLTFYFPPSRMPTCQPSCLWKPLSFYSHCFIHDSFQAVPSEKIISDPFSFQASIGERCSKY